MRTFLTFIPRSFLTRIFLTLIFLSPSLWSGLAFAQDPGMQAAQQAQMAAQLATQQANDQMMQAAQQANNQAMQNAQQATQSGPQCYRCFAAMPKFSVKAGKYSRPLTIKMRDASRGAVIYYTTDGWTPTGSSIRYRGPISITSTTSIQAIAISSLGGRSRVATAVYTLNGVPPATADVPVSAGASTAALGADSSSSPNGSLLLARGTAVPLAFGTDVSSKTADVGDKIALTLAEDLKAGNMIVARKGAPATAIVTEVDKNGMGGMPGEVFFEADSMQVGNMTIKLHGGAAKEGQDKVGKAIGLMFIPGAPVGVFVHGKDAEIKPGAVFTAFVDADTLLPPAN
jgi:hypothetical protein